MRHENTVKRKFTQVRVVCEWDFASRGISRPDSFVFSGMIVLLPFHRMRKRLHSLCSLLRAQGAKSVRIVRMILERKAKVSLSMLLVSHAFS